MKKDEKKNRRECRTTTGLSAITNLNEVKRPGVGGQVGRVLNDK
jgi:hypothetical protein